MYKYSTKNFCWFVCIIFILFGGLSFAGCDSKTIADTDMIDSLRWEVVADIQEPMSFDESGWEIPDGAIVYKEQEEIKSYKIVGYETKYRTEEYQELVGYYRPSWRPRYETRTRQTSYQEPITEPIYATKYYYTIYRWVTTKHIQLAEGYTNDYNYPEYICAENERVYNVEYRYLVHLKSNGERCAYIVSQNVWENLNVGQEVCVEKNQHGVITNVDWDNINN